MQELEPLINQTVDLIKGSKEFVLSQAPDFIRQFIIYSYLSSLGWIVLSSIILYISIIFGLKLKANWDGLRGDACFFQALIIVIFSTGSLLILVTNLDYLALIHFAPKVYIVTHLASFLKGN